MYEQEITIQVRDAPTSPDNETKDQEEDNKGLYIVFEDYEHIPFIITEKRFKSQKKYNPNTEFLNIPDSVRIPTETDISMEDFDFLQSSHDNSRTSLINTKSQTSFVNKSQSFQRLPK